MASSKRKPLVARLVKQTLLTILSPQLTLAPAKPNTASYVSVTTIIPQIAAIETKSLVVSARNLVMRIRIAGSIKGNKNEMVN